MPVLGTGTRHRSPRAIPEARPRGPESRGAPTGRLPSRGAPSHALVPGPLCRNGTGRVCHGGFDVMRVPRMAPPLVFGLALTLWIAAAGPSRAEPIALTPATFIDTASGSGSALGSVDTGHRIFSLNASLNDLLSIDVNVTDVRVGTRFTD